MQPNKNRELLVKIAEGYVRSLTGKPNFFELGPANLTATSARTSCSTFITTLLKRTFDINGIVWIALFGKKSPRAREYESAFHQGMLPVVQNIKDVRPGMIGAIGYDEVRTGATGHCVIASEPPVEHAKHGELTKYRLMVIDSSRTSHGVGDTRIVPGGIGRGIMGLFADRSGKIVGYTWSLAADSEVMHNEKGQRISFADVPSEWLAKENQNG